MNVSGHRATGRTGAARCVDTRRVEDDPETCLPEDDCADCIDALAAEEVGQDTGAPNEAMGLVVELRKSLRLITYLVVRIRREHDNMIV